MFTGIVEELGTVRRVLPGAQAGKIAIGAHKVLEDVHIGDSIAVNGVCLTVVSVGDDEFVADIMPETMRTSNLGHLKVGDAVDLERAMPAHGRFGGHIVSGHIDGVGRISSLRRERNAVIVTIEVPAHIMALVVHKGSIAIDGVSLTVAAATSTSLSVSLIPHTAAETVLLLKRVGDSVNLETDVVGKYVQKLLGGAGGLAAKPAQASISHQNLSWEYLQANGF